MDIKNVSFNIPLRTETSAVRKKQEKPLEQLGSGSTDSDKALSSTASSAGSMSMEQLNKAVEDANRRAASANRQLNFSIDSATDRVVVKVVDGNTGEVVRQIPSEEMLKLAADIAESEKRGGQKSSVIFSKRF